MPRNNDGRPICKPPILAFSAYIGEDYEKKRQALLKYKDGDVARVTEIMDAEREMNPEYEYREWVVGNVINPLPAVSEKFFEDFVANLEQEQTTVKFN